MKPLTRVIFLSVLVFLALNLMVGSAVAKGRGRGTIQEELYGKTQDDQEVYEYT